MIANEKVDLVVAIGPNGTNYSETLNVVEATRLAAYLSRACERSTSAGGLARTTSLRWQPSAAPVRWDSASGSATLRRGGTACIVTLGLGLGHVAYWPQHDPLRQLVHGESGAAVRDAIAAGSLILCERAMLTCRRG
ncbi:MAG: hypothetical protein HC882_06985, partial [Acidobacteria bacterium]|nr:hypothetical protein [Acidobacteriota bacterium]